jgi:hypothetical protein
MARKPKERPVRILKEKVNGKLRYYVKIGGKKIVVEDQRGTKKDKLFEIAKLLIKSTIYQNRSADNRKRRIKQNRKSSKRISEGEKKYPILTNTGHGSTPSLDNAAIKQEQQLIQYKLMQAKLEEDRKSSETKREKEELEKKKLKLEHKVDKLQIQLANANIPRILPPPRIVPVTPTTPVPHRPLPIPPVKPSTGPIPRKKPAVVKDDEDVVVKKTLVAQVQKDLAAGKVAITKVDQRDLIDRKNAFYAAIANDTVKKQILGAIGQSPTVPNPKNKNRPMARTKDDVMKFLKAGDSIGNVYNHFIKNQFDPDNPLRSIKDTLIPKLTETKANLRGIDADLEEDVEEPVVEDPDVQEGTGYNVSEGGLLETDIVQIAADLRLPGFLGVIASDEMYKIVQQYQEELAGTSLEKMSTENGSGGALTRDDRISWVMNLDPRSKPGSHWIGIFIDPSEDMSVDYFDSYAREPTDEFLRGLAKLIKVMDPPMYLKLKINRIVEQRADTNICGWGALRFIVDRYKDKDWKECSGYHEARSIAKSEGAVRDFEKIVRKKFDYV